MRQPQDANSAFPAPTPPPARPNPTHDAGRDPRYEAEIAAIERDLIAEIERIEREAAARERALIAERDAFRAQLQIAHDTKGWRASVAYWNARQRGLVGALDLGGQLATYLARVGYHLGVPYRLRRDLWYRRSTGASYQRYLRTLSQPRPSAPLDDAANPERVRKAVGPDALIFAARAWDDSDARQRRAARQLAAAGHRCRWLTPLLTVAPAGEIGAVAARDVEAGVGADGAEIVELALPGDGGDVTARPVFRQTALRHALRALRRYCFEHDLREVVCVVQHPGWAPLVEALRAAYGWKVFADLAADLDSEPSDAHVGEALTASDLIIASADSQRDGLARQGLATPAMTIAEGDPPEALSAAVRGLYGRATIIIVTYRNLEKTRLTLKSVLEQTRYPNYEALLVDNGADPDIRAYARAMAERFPATVRCIFNAENLGFAGANNVGLRAAQDSEYVVLLNDDVIVTPGWLGALLRYLADPQIGLVGPVTNAAGNEARIPVDYSDPDGITAFARAYTFAHDGASFEIPVLAMFCLAMRQRTAAELGELDERFRVGMFEDDDYAMRARAAGYRLVCAEDVFVHHFGRSSFSQMSEEAHARLFAANRAVFEQKWGVLWQPHKYREG